MIVLQKILVACKSFGKFYWKAIEENEVCDQGKERGGVIFLVRWDIQKGKESFGKRSFQNFGREGGHGVLKIY